MKETFEAIHIVITGRSVLDSEAFFLVFCHNIPVKIAIKRSKDLSVSAWRNEFMHIYSY
jgi:hypothetical protein